MFDNQYLNEHKKSVLIIDDDIDLIHHFKTVFEMEDFNVHTAYNGKEAIDMLRTMQESELPDVIMLDYMMPIMNGEKFSQVRQNDPRIKRIPVVLMTANRDIANVLKTVNVNAFVEKPMDVANMVRIAENYAHLHMEESKRILH